MTEGQWKLLGGGGLAALAVVLIVVASPGPGNTKGCELAGSAIPLLVTELRKGHSSAAVEGVLAGVGLSSACRSAIDSWVNEPDKALPLSTGGHATTVTGNDLRLPPPQPRIVINDRTLRCLGWRSGLLYDLCVRGSWPLPTS